LNAVGQRIPSRDIPEFFPRHFSRIDQEIISEAYRHRRFLEIAGGCKRIARSLHEGAGRRMDTTGARVCGFDGDLRGRRRRTVQRRASDKGKKELPEVESHMLSRPGSIPFRSFHGAVQQHPDVCFASPLHPQTGSPPVSAALNRACAQPTPAFTVTAPGAQLRWQAPHSMQLSRKTISAFFS
jgi:hypothetical protein